MFKSKKPAIWFKVFFERSQINDFIEEYKLDMNSTFSSDLWIQKQTFFLHHAKSGPMPRFSVLPNFMAQNGLNSVVDFGGGSGWLGFYLPENCFYVNQEIGTLVRHFGELNTSKNRIITEDASNFVTNVDVLYSNSVIQYLSDTSSFINLIDSFNPSYIVLDDLQTSTKSEFFSIQRYFNSFLITKFYNLINFIEEIEANDYILMKSINYPHTVSSRMGYRVDQRSWRDPNICKPKSLFFKKLI